MPQTHLIEDKEKARSVVFRNIYPIEDRTAIIIKSHLLLEAMLYKFVQSKVTSSQFLDKARLSFYQILNISKSFRNKNQVDKEHWMWGLIEYVNKLRNELAHNIDIEVEDIDSRIERMYEIAGYHIAIHAPGADPSEREAKKVNYFLIILCGVVFNLDNPDFEI